MEDLNKTQIVLLTLFITFVTSVTTGIVTVTLLQQAPPGVTQTINRVVERTIEKVTPATIKTEVTTRVVAQEDEIIRVAALVKPAIVRIVLSGEMAVSTSTADLAALAVLDINYGDEIGTGFFISPDGLVATSYSLIPDQYATYGIYVGDKKYPADVIAYNMNDNLAILKIDHEKDVKFFTPQFISKPVVLGQTVVVLGRDLTRYTVSTGLITSLEEETRSKLPSYKTTVKSDETNIGGPLLSSDGLVVGLNLEGGNALPIELIRSYLSGLASTTKTSI